jgi:hypothetical protein
LGEDCTDIPLFLDIGSPPMLSGFSAYPFFFSFCHPLAAYISQQWRPLPLLDTSGGNVTYACLSLAGSLGAQRITVYGADFSYPLGRVYARGTYIYPFFERKQERRSPLEAHFSSFLYRSPFLPPETAEGGDGVAPYETATLRFYRKSFEKKVLNIKAHVTAAHGSGIPLCIREKTASLPFGVHGRIFSLFAPGKMIMSADRFLEQYRQDIDTLPVSGAAYLHNLNGEQRRIFTTLLPQAAAIKHRRPHLSTQELLEAVKYYCIHEIDRILNIVSPEIPE